jgi:hypothetical protein
MMSFKEFCIEHGLNEEIKGWKHAGRDLNKMRSLIEAKLLCLSNWSS